LLLFFFSKSHPGFDIATIDADLNSDIKGVSDRHDQIGGLERFFLAVIQLADAAGRLDQRSRLTPYFPRVFSVTERVILDFDPDREKFRSKMCDFE
jgi:hypothetical protein